MKNALLLSLTVLPLTVLLLIVGCNKDQNKKLTQTDALQQEFAEIKQKFDSSHFESKLIDRSIGKTSFQWVAMWDRTCEKGSAGGAVYYYIPLVPKELGPTGKILDRPVKQIGLRKYLLVRKTDSGMEFTIANYFSDAFRDVEVDDSIFFRSFTGTMAAVSLSNRNFYRYVYEGGKTMRPTKRAQGHWETQCTTYYICSWTAYCITGPYVTATQGSDCTPPPPLSDSECHTSGNEGDNTWTLTYSSPQEDCQQVWVDDPPPPGGGGGSSVASITNNLNNPWIKSVFSSIGNTKLSNTITSILHEFGASQQYQYVFSDSWSRPVDAHTSPIKAADGTIIGYNIQLNGNMVGNYSQEALTEIIDHEIMHAFIDAPAITVSQSHEIMLNTFLTDLVTANQQVNPTLSTRDATALALYGLSSLNYFDETGPGFQAALNANNLTLNDINTIYKQYTTGVNGVISGTRPH